MHPFGPPRKFFRASGSSRGARLPHPGATQDFTVDRDIPSGGFYQSQPFLPPPPLEGAPFRFPPGPRPPFSPYPPLPHYGYHPRLPGIGPHVGHWGQRGGYQDHHGRGGWRGRGRFSGGFRGRSGRYPYSRRGGSLNDIEAYYSRTMFEDPWKDLLPQEERSEEVTAPLSLDQGTAPNQGGTSTRNELEQENTESKIDSTTDMTAKSDNHLEGSYSSAEASSNVNITESSEGCSTSGSGNGSGTQSQVEPAGTNGSRPNYVQKDDCCMEPVANTNSNETKDMKSRDKLCLTSTDQEHSQFRECATANIQD